MNRAEPAAFLEKAVVVTGVSKPGQVGQAVALAFASRGAIVHCIARDGDVEERVAELNALGLRGVAHVVDLTDFKATAAVAGAIAAAHDGGVSAVAAIAGGFGASGPVATSDPAVLSRQMAINATSAYSTALAFAPSVRAARGAFVFAAAAAVLAGGKVDGLSAYAMSKGALVQLMRALAQEERVHGVRANAVAPTAVRTATNLASMGERFRYIEREELAETVVALCGPAFARVTGQVFELA